MLGKAITVSRPLFWIGPFAAYATGLAVAGVQRGFFESWELLLMTFPVSFYIYAVNDFFDIGPDQRNPRKSGVWGEPLKQSEMEWARNLCISIAALLLITSIISFNPLHVLFTALGLIVPLAYSAPPLRLKNIPVLDSISNISYGFVPFAMAASLGNCFAYLDARFLSFLLVLPAVHAITTVMDYEKDKKEGQSTFAVSFGMRAPSIFAAAVFLGNSILFFQLSPIAGISLAFAAMVSLVLAVFPSPENARRAFKVLFAYGLALGYFFFIKYFLFPQYLADYSEAEFSNFISLCESGDIPDTLCLQLEAAREACSENPAALAPGFCDFLKKNPAQQTS